MIEPYTIEIESDGCEKCGHGKQWAIMRPDGVCLGQTWENPEEAQQIADWMNEAFVAGQLTPHA